MTRLDWLLMLVAGVIVLYAVRENQLRPHHRIVRAGANVLADEWTTNRFEIVVEAVADPMGQTVLVYRTNELWSVWPIFR